MAHHIGFDDFSHDELAKISERRMRNAVERCRLRQAKRLVELLRPLTRDDLVIITDQDVYGSSVFDTVSPADADDAGGNDPVDVDVDVT